MLPAYAANGLAPTARFIKNKHPVDFNKTWKNKPILGPGKTWEGLLLGTLVAVLVSIIQMIAFPFLPWSLSEYYGVTLNIVHMTPFLGALLGFGAMFGDIVGSLIKRRIGLKRGRPAPILDQDDFVIGSLVFASLLVVIEPSWLILFIIITPVLHFLSCFIGYKLKIKREPY